MAISGYSSRMLGRLEGFRGSWPMLYFYREPCGRKTVVLRVGPDKRGYIILTLAMAQWVQKSEWCSKHWEMASLPKLDIRTSMRCILPQLEHRTRSPRVLIWTEKWLFLNWFFIGSLLLNQGIAHHSRMLPLFIHKHLNCAPWSFRNLCKRLEFHPVVLANMDDLVSSLYCGFSSSYALWHLLTNQLTPTEKEVNLHMLKRS